MSIVLLTNFIGLKDIGPRYTFKTLNCGRNLKQCLFNFPYEDCYRSFSTCMREEKDFVFPSSNVTILERKTKPKEETFTKEEQEVNLKRCERLNFYGKNDFICIFIKLVLDRKVCEKLCVKINEEDDVVCEHICETQLSDHGQTQNICPFQEQCPSGCPCPLYECEHVDTNKVPLAWFYEEGNNLFKTYHGMSVNELIWLALQNGKAGNFIINDAVPDPRLNEIFSRVVSINSTNLAIDTIYDRIGNFKTQ